MKLFLVEIKIKVKGNQTRVFKMIIPAAAIENLREDLKLFPAWCRNEKLGPNTESLEHVVARAEPQAVTICEPVELNNSRYNNFFQLSSELLPY